MGAEQSIINLQELNTGNFNMNFPLAQCRIVVVGPRSGDACLTELAHLPKEARIMATGMNLKELEQDSANYSEGNVILNVSGNAAILTEIIENMPFLTWIHSITAGVDHILCPAITDNEDITLTNAKGVFSDSLAEFVMTACSYFAKDIPRLMKQKQDHNYEKFCVSELRGKTMGIIGYGNIGMACAKLATAYGMKVVALRRNPSLCEKDRYVDSVYGPDKLSEVLFLSDYLVVCLALTPETHHFINKDNIQFCNKDMVLINIGRGQLIDEDALIEALAANKIKGAALDVFTTEPLPIESELWDLPNLLLSPHNADLTLDSRHKSVRFFTYNCQKFIAEEDLECIVDKQSGY